MIDGQHRAIHHDSREVHRSHGGGDDRGARRGRDVDAAVASGVRGGRSDVALRQSWRRHRPEPPRRRSGGLRGRACLAGFGRDSLQRLHRGDAVDRAQRGHEGRAQRRGHPQCARHRPCAMSAHPFPSVPFSRPVPRDGPPTAAPRRRPRPRFPCRRPRRSCRPGSVHNPSQAPPCAGQAPAVRVCPIGTFRPLSSRGGRTERAHTTHAHPRRARAPPGLHKRSGAA